MPAACSCGGLLEVALEPLRLDPALFDTLLASFLVTGSISWLYYADRLVEFPLGIFGIALGTVILPVLSRAHASDSSLEFSRTLDAGLRWVLLIGLPNEEAALAVIAFLFAHALYKAPLFFVAGNIDHATGTRNIDHLMSLRRQMPFTTVAAILAGLSMAGLPLSFGYVAKDVVSAAKSGTDLLALVSYGLLFVNGIAVAVAAVAAPARVSRMISAAERRARGRVGAPRQLQPSG